MTNCDLVSVTLYENSNDKVAKRSSRDCCQLILVVEDVKLDKPNFLFQSSDPKSTEFASRDQATVSKAKWLLETSAQFLQS
mgnify:CR=1 FL=1